MCVRSSACGLQAVVAEMKRKSKWRKYETVPQVSQVRTLSSRDIRCSRGDDTIVRVFAQAWAAVELFTDVAILPG